MTAYILYGTEGCHLCEDALMLVRAENVDFVECDIVNDPAAMSLYGIRIPVLHHCASRNELGWPFDRTSLLEFLAQN